MPKEFYTERDIEDMVKRGILSLQLNDNVVLTDLAYERANRLGMQLLPDKPNKPPGAPVRPYIVQQEYKPAVHSMPAPVPSFAPPPQQASFSGAQVVPPAQADGSELHQRIRSAVVARLGTQVDAKLLDVIIARVLKSTGMK